jgi:hypothetical protein
MKTEYELSIGGLGHFLVSASVNKKSGIRSSLECEVVINNVKKFDDMLEEYIEYDVPSDELLIIEQQVAVKFFNQLH